jgi:hypothetical protein
MIAGQRDDLIILSQMKQGNSLIGMRGSRLPALFYSERERLLSPPEKRLDLPDGCTIPQSHGPD